MSSNQSCPSARDSPSLPCQARVAAQNFECSFLENGGSDRKKGHGEASAFTCTMYSPASLSYILRVQLENMYRVLAVKIGGKIFLCAALIETSSDHARCIRRAICERLDRIRSLHLVRRQSSSIYPMRARAATKVSFWRRRRGRTSILVFSRACTW